MLKRLTDLVELEPPHWIIAPFCVDVTTVSLYLQKELIDMQSDCEEKARFTMMGYERFWMEIPGRNKFPNLWLVWAFPTPNLVERSRSIANEAKKQARYLLLWRFEITDH